MVLQNYLLPDAALQFMIYYMLTNLLNFAILKFGLKELLLDFNHPLVGFGLHFEGKVIEVRKATKKELEQGHLEEENRN